MLTHLYIKNYALIDELDLEFHSGFSVITGETGAGKSIMLGALGLLLGQRADAKMVKDGAQRCIIEAHFQLGAYDMQPFFEEHDIDWDADDSILRRELTAAGKSRAFINDTPVALGVMRELGEQLVDIHSQHQNLLLRKDDFQLGVVDIMAHLRPQTDQYRALFNAYRDKQQQWQQLKEQIESNREREDFLRYQLQELEGANLHEGEQEQLEQRGETMQHSEDIKRALYTSDQWLSADEGIVSRVRSAAHELSSIAPYFPAAAEYAERLESCHIELKDLAAEISSSVDDVDFDPREQERIEARLDLLYQLERKYHVEDEQALIALTQELRTELDMIDHGDEQCEALQREVKRLKDEVEAKAATLSEQRKAMARPIADAICQRLTLLGMPHVRFEVHFESKPLAADGSDRVQFLFSANSSTALQPVAQVASGGESARVMLALKALISGAVKLPTIIFDEIDTGVSGKAAEQMARIMAEMGDNGRQVISITHLPQIAALGSSHYLVYKEEGAEGTVSRTRELSVDERVCEIAQMLSGSRVSDAALAQARELLGGKS